MDPIFLISLAALALVLLAIAVMAWQLGPALPPTPDLSKVALSRPTPGSKEKS